MLVPSENWRATPADPKALCNKILQATIKEEDKYQEGLTKIFFRAGMLALLESWRSNRLNQLVTLIQKNVKRRLAVQRYQEMRSSAIRIQTWWRGILARRFVLDVRKETAALRVQRATRTFMQRSKFHAIRRSIVAIQNRAFSCLSPLLHL
jgi:myosin-5